MFILVRKTRNNKTILYEAIVAQGLEHVTVNYKFDSHSGECNLYI